MARFSHYRSFRILTQETKAKVFKYNTLLKVEGFRLSPMWKIWTLFFFEESEFQILANSILIPVSGISSMWNSQNDMCQQIQFQIKLVFFGAGETRIVKQNCSK